MSPLRLLLVLSRSPRSFLHEQSRGLHRSGRDSAIRSADDGIQWADGEWQSPARASIVDSDERGLVPRHCRRTRTAAHPGDIHKRAIRIAHRSGLQLQRRRPWLQCRRQRLRDSRSRVRDASPRKLPVGLRHRGTISCEIYAALQRTCLTALERRGQHQHVDAESLRNVIRRLSVARSRLPKA
jgi:hypothetical protein